MKCPSPPLADSLRNVIRSKRSEVKRRKQKEVKVVQLGFIMDGVVSLQNLSYIPDMNSQLYYYTNPRVFNFTEAGGIMKLKGENLIIEGEDLDIAADKSEVSVMIGREHCNVSVFSSSQIVCKLPNRHTDKGQQVNSGNDPQTLPYVKVRVSNLQFTVGRVKYDAPETFEFPTEAIAGIAAGGSFLLLIIILILIIYHFQSTKAERIYKKLQIQLDNLESNVRNE